MRVVNKSTMRTEYEVLNDQGEVVAQLSTYEEAHEYVLHVTLQDPYTRLTIEKREHYTVKGLGRDPDLH